MGIQPDRDIEAFMKAHAMEGKREHIGSEFVMRILGLDICAETYIGNHVIRGISGGQRKRVTTGREPNCVPLFVLDIL